MNEFATKLYEHLKTNPAGFTMEDPQHCILGEGRFLITGDHTGFREPNRTTYVKSDEVAEMLGLTHNEGEQLFFCDVDETKTAVEAARELQLYCDKRLSMGLASLSPALAWVHEAPPRCPTLNRSNFLTLINHIEQKPDSEIDMNQILKCDRQNETVREAVRPGCGTVNCIAGDAWLLKMLRENPDRIIEQQNVNGLCVVVNNQLKQPFEPYDGLVGEIITEAAEWLGLPLREAVDLFYGNLYEGKTDLVTVTKLEVLAKLRQVAEDGVI